MNNLLDRIGGVRDVDNRPLEDMVAYLEARCEALSRRNHVLEIENAELRKELSKTPNCIDEYKPLIA